LTLLLALAVLPALASEPPGDLQLYLATADHYATVSRVAAVQEIRRWSPLQLVQATAALRRQEKKLRARVQDPGDIDFHTIEAAVLMHAEAGLLYLQQQSPQAAKVHIDTAVALRLWSVRAAAERRNWIEMRRHAFEKIGRPPDPRLELKVTIDGTDFYVALSAAALALGYPHVALPLAEQAAKDAPFNPEVSLVLGCAASAQDWVKSLEHQDDVAAQARATAENAWRETLTLAPGTHEARLRLGKLLLDEQRTGEAEPLLAEVDVATTDQRQRYLARLFLGRAADRRGQPGEAVRSYNRALEAWPQSQAARLGLAHALEKAFGAGASRPVIGEALDPSRPRDGPSDPWFVYHIGPPGLARAAFDRVWNGTLGK